VKNKQRQGFRTARAAWLLPHPLIERTAHRFNLHFWHFSLQFYSRRSSVERHQWLCSNGFTSTSFQHLVPTWGESDSNWNCNTSKLLWCVNGTENRCWYAGPAFDRLDRLHPIGPRAKGGAALRLQTYANLYFQSKLLV